MWCAIKHVCVLKYLGHYLISIFWQIRNNKNPNSYHRHKGCAWFVPDLLRWRVSSCDVWIFPVVNNITSVLQYFPSNVKLLVSLTFMLNIFVFLPHPSFFTTIKNVFLFSSHLYTLERSFVALSSLFFMSTLFSSSAFAWWDIIIVWLS